MPTRAWHRANSSPEGHRGEAEPTRRSPVELIGLLGAWLGAGWATRLRSETLYRVIAVLLLAIAAVLLVGHDVAAGAPLFTSSC